MTTTDAETSSATSPWTRIAPHLIWAVAAVAATGIIGLCFGGGGATYGDGHGVSSPPMTDRMPGQGPSPVPGDVRELSPTDPGSATRSRPRPGSTDAPRSESVRCPDGGIAPPSLLDLTGLRWVCSDSH